MKCYQAISVRIHRWLVILILLVYMGTVIVILLNILIAQLSYTYGEAKKTAKLQYAVDTMKIVSRMECSIFPCWVSGLILRMFCLFAIKSYLKCIKYVQMVRFLFWFFIEF